MIVIGDVLHFLQLESFTQTDLNQDGDLNDQVHLYKNLNTGESGNTKIAGKKLNSHTWKSSEEPWLIVEVEENEQNQDINHDGDLTDSVIALHDLESHESVLINLAVHDYQRSHRDKLLLIHVPESSQNADLNGDQVISEDRNILHIYDIDTGLIKNIGVQAKLKSELLTEFLFSLSEGENNQDFNEDGDKNDYVFHFLDKASLTLRNTKIINSDPTRHIFNFVQFGSLEWIYFFSPNSSTGDEVEINEDDLEIIAYHAPSKTFKPIEATSFWTTYVLHNLIIYQKDEKIEVVDLNEDGDLNDLVAHLQIPDTGKITNLKIAGSFKYIEGDSLYFLVSEEAQNQDLNEDEILDSEIYFRYDLQKKTLTNMKINGHINDYFKLPNRDCVILSRHESNLRKDLNGDGDFHDQESLKLYPPVNAEGVITNQNIEFTSNGKFLTWLLERENGKDLNGDGDLNDEVIHELNCEGNGFMNLGFPGFISGTYKDYLLLSIEEDSEDLNEDGDSNDTIFHLYNFTTQKLINLKLPGRFGWLDDGIAYLRVSEHQAGIDLNGDSRTNDEIAQLYYFGSDEILNLKEAISLKFMVGHRAVGTISEAHKNMDLNGDGDKKDEVLHIVDTLTREIYNLQATTLHPVFNYLEFHHLLYFVSEDEAGIDLDGDGLISNSPIAHFVNLKRLRDYVPDFIRGDCNQDGSLDISDPVQTLVDLFLPKDGKRLICEDACDTNDDGIVEIVDPVITLGYLFLGQGGIPAPGAMDCGEDPTNDEIGCQSFEACRKRP